MLCHFREFKIGKSAKVGDLMMTGFSHFMISSWAWIDTQTQLNQIKLNQTNLLKRRKVMVCVMHEQAKSKKTLCLSQRPGNS